jgi:hypothetical protein
MRRIGRTEILTLDILLENDLNNEDLKPQVVDNTRQYQTSVAVF